MSAPFPPITIGDHQFRRVGSLVVTAERFSTLVHSRHWYLQELAGDETTVTGGHVFSPDWSALTPAGKFFDAPAIAPRLDRSMEEMAQDPAIILGLIGILRTNPVESVACDSKTLTITMHDLLCMVRHATNALPVRDALADVIWPLFASGIITVDPKNLAQMLLATAEESASTLSSNYVAGLRQYTKLWNRSSKPTIIMDKIRLLQATVTIVRANL